MRVKAILVIFFISIFLINLASADCFVTPRANCQGENKMVLGLSSLTNAHAELANQNNYDYALCCRGGSNTTCSGTNEIVSLYTQTNSHAEVPQLNNYGNKICYEDFSCTGRTSCNSGETALLSLVNDTNSHVGVYSEHSIKICCKSNFLDSDNDEISYIHDPDNNGDGIMDFPYDLIISTGDIDSDGILNINDANMDGDGILNGHDPDFNNDGIMDLFTQTITAPNGDVDGDGILNINDGDIDGDGILNGYDSDVDGNGATDIFCGNNLRETGEECDDGNHRNGDGCSRTCREEGDDDDDRRSSDSDDDDDEDCRASWSCSGWSDCSDGIKTRTCIDRESCGTTSNKPSEVESCEEISETLIQSGTISLGSSYEKSGSLNTIFWFLIIGVVVVLILILIIKLLR